MIFLKYLLPFLMGLSVFAQKELPLNSANFEYYIHQVYTDKSDSLILSNSKLVKDKKELLERIFIINGVTNYEDHFLDFKQLYIINTYNTSLKQEFPDYLDPDNFNPFLYKMNIYSTDIVCYYYAKSKQIIKLYPKKNK